MLLCNRTAHKLESCEEQTTNLIQVILLHEWLAKSARINSYIDDHAQVVQLQTPKLASVPRESQAR